MNCEKCNIEMTMEKYDTTTMLFNLRCKRCGKLKTLSKKELESMHSEINQSNNKFLLNNFFSKNCL